MSHTPTPWTVKQIKSCTYIETLGPPVSGHYSFIADIQTEECSNKEELDIALANAAFIVRAVNSFEAMREALRVMHAFLVSQSDDADYTEAYITPRLKQIEAALRAAERE